MRGRLWPLVGRADELRVIGGAVRGRDRPATAAALLEEALGGPVVSSAARALWAITRGNVLYLRQLVEGELEAGRLLRTGGVWQWSGRPQLSPGLSELLHDRIGLRRSLTRIALACRADTRRQANP